MKEKENNTITHRQTTITTKTRSTCMSRMHIDTTGRYMPSAFLRCTLLMRAITHTCHFIFVLLFSPFFFFFSPFLLPREWLCEGGGERRGENIHIRKKKKERHTTKDGDPTRHCSLSHTHTHTHIQYLRVCVYANAR